MTLRRPLGLVDAISDTLAEALPPHAVETESADEANDPRPSRCSSAGMRLERHEKLPTRPIFRVCERSGRLIVRWFLLAVMLGFVVYAYVIA